MNIILNGQSLTPPRTGIGRYTLEIMQGLKNSPRIDKVYSFVHGRWQTTSDSHVPSPGPEKKGGRSRGVLKAWVKKIPFAYDVKHYVQQKVIDLHAARLDSPIYHETNYVLSTFAVPAVVTVHDLSHLLYPECHPLERVRYLERELPKTLERAEHIICVSEFIRHQMHDMLGIDLERMTAIHLGVSEAMRPASPQQLGVVRRKYALPEKGYILVVATREPRKNLRRLVEAYLQVQGRMRCPLPLVFAGHKGWKSKQLDKELARLERQGLVRRIGYVAEKDLPHVYAGASMFAFPSLYEGFGLPPLEAMACGVPVLAARTSAMTEVIADAGLLVDPYDVCAIAQGLEQLAEDECLRRDLIEKGKKRAAGFTWEQCIQRTIDIYEQVRRIYY